MNTHKHQPAEAKNIVATLPATTAEVMALQIPGQSTHGLSALSRLQPVTPATLGKNDFFPCTRKKRWEEKALIQIMPEQA